MCAGPPKCSMQELRPALHPAEQLPGCGGGGGGGGACGGKNRVAPSSAVTALIGLKIIDVFVALPPQRIPTSVALVAADPEPGGIVNTGEPLSPPCDPAAANVEHRATKLEPASAVLTQVAVTVPPVQPVVRPTFVTRLPTIGAAPVPVRVSADLGLGKASGQTGAVTQSVLGFAITLAAPLGLGMSNITNAESLKRHCLPVGHPGIAVQTGSAVSWPT